MESWRDIPESVLLAVIGAISASLGALGRPILDSILGRRNRYREEFADDLVYLRSEIDRLKDEVSQLQTRLREKDTLVAKKDAEVSEWRDKFYAEQKERARAEHERDMSALLHTQLLNRLKAQGKVDDTDLY